MSTSTPVWDPLPQASDDIIALERREQEEELADNQQYQNYLKHAGRLRLILGILIAIPVGFAIWIYGIERISMDPRILILLAIPALLYYSAVQRLAAKLVKEVIAQQENWQYSSIEDPNRWSTLSTLYPEIFMRGDRKQCVYDEFWGSTPVQNQPVSFWMTNFRYTTGSGKNSHTSEESVYALPLPRTVASDFVLAPKEWLSSLFSRQKLETESNDFNKAFVIEYKGQRSTEGPEIFQTLTPPVQEQL